MNDNLEMEYFEKGLGMVLGQLEYLIDQVRQINSKYVQQLTTKLHQIDEVKDNEEYQKLAASFSDLRVEILNDIDFKNNREVFILSTEIEYLNKHLLHLLTKEEHEHQTIPKVESYFQEQFELKIRELLEIDDKQKVFDSEVVKILKILEKEKKFDDIEEGLNLVFSLTTLNEKSWDLYQLLAEADVISIYLDLLKQKSWE